MKHWDDDERVEYDEACREAWQSSERQNERTDRMVEIITDAEKAQRAWAGDVHADALRNGLAEKLKYWNKASNSIAVSHEGAFLTKSRVIGVTRRDDDGNRYSSQALFDYMTWGELSEKRREYLRQRMAYDADIGVIDRLLALHELAPGTANPADAVTQLGMTLESYLGEAAAG